MGNSTQEGAGEILPIRAFVGREEEKHGPTMSFASSLLKERRRRYLDDVVHRGQPLGLTEGLGEEMQ